MTDITMGALLIARERTYSEWESLIVAADPRFSLKEVIRPKESALVLIDIHWNA
jgi:hypothetical protein